MAHRAITRLIRPTLALVLATAMGPALADTNDTLNILFGAVIAHEDNLFHLPPGADPQAALGTSSGADRASINYLGAIVDKTYSQQHFQLDARTTRSRYDTFKHLDFSATRYQGAWRWSATHWLTGSLEASQEQSLVNFADFQDYSKLNTRSLRNKSFSIDADLTGGWHLLGKTAQLRRNDTYAIVAEGNFKQDSIETGVKYVDGSGSSLALIARTAEGEYTDRGNDPATLLDTNYEQRDAELRANWPISAKSTLLGSLTRLKRQHAHFAQRDFSGTAHQLGYQWKPTAKLKVELTKKREIASYQEPSSSYAVSNDMDGAATWAILPKLTMQLKLNTSRRDFLGAVAAVTDKRQDRFRSAQFGMEWMPLQNLTLTANLQRDRRNSNRTSFEYEATSSSLAAQLVF